MHPTACLLCCRKRDPFDVKETTIKNLVTGATIEDETSSFPLNCLTEGKTAYDKFRHERLDTKSAQLFDTITKTQTCSKKVKVWKAPDVKQETINFLRTVDYARLRDFGVMSLLTHEVATTSYLRRMVICENHQNHSLLGN